ncbi:hypothetical protein KAU88_03630 [Candidatus Bathyarchaeota archaeon]|nr:hypothetical protein [Candidatus Bathyarchaeota archaeon]
MRRRAKRDTYIYELKDGNSIVQYGITNNPDVRVIQHDNAGKEFTHLRVIRGPMSRERAMELEAFYIQRYQRQHGGDPPEYNTYKTY